MSSNCLVAAESSHRLNSHRKVKEFWQTLVTDLPRPEMRTSRKSTPERPQEHVDLSGGATELNSG